MHVLLVLNNLPSIENNGDGRSIQIGLNVSSGRACYQPWKVQVFGIEIDCDEETIIKSPDQQATVLVCGKVVSLLLRNSIR